MQFYRIPIIGMRSKIIAIFLTGKMVLTIFHTVY